MPVDQRPLIPVVLSGGSGSRLWPLSREQRPKQFLPLVGEQTLFQQTIARVGALGASRLRPPIVVCNETHRFLVAEQLLESGVAAEAIVLEPIGRNTAPAVGVAALLALEAEAKRSASEAGDPLLLVLPADHVILDDRAFAAAVEAAVPAAAQGYLVTFGVAPGRPETGYGYLQRGRDMGGWATVERFVEKPDLATAKTYLDSGEYLWNSGMFLFSVKAFLRELGAHAPPIRAACEQAVAEAVVDADFVRLGAAFSACPADSVDYAVMEKTDRAAVVPLAAGWSDVGSWAALHDVLPKDSDGNVVAGDVLLEACRDTYAVAHSRLVALVGLTNVVVVETGDAVLVMAREQSQQLKRVVDALRNANRAEIRGTRVRSDVQKSLEDIDETP
jgi:mannose-1-phosphate guanylyltransferase/mannose-6-phosphate isomerase